MLSCRLNWIWLVVCFWKEEEQTLTFSPLGPRGPASPGRPERPFGPSGPSSPLGPADPISPWKSQHTQLRSLAFLQSRHSATSAAPWCSLSCHCFSEIALKKVWPSKDLLSSEKKQLNIWFLLLYIHNHTFVRKFEIEIILLLYFRLVHFLICGNTTATHWWCWNGKAVIYRHLGHFFISFKSVTCYLVILIHFEIKFQYK